MFKMGINNPSKALTMENPQSYELPQPLKSLNKENGHSSSRLSSNTNRQLRHMLDPEGRKAGNWFNDSFDEGDTEDRYATRPHLLSISQSADTANARGSSNKETGATPAEENIYDNPDEALANYSEARLSNNAAAYECPKDTNEEDIYDDIIVNPAAVIKLDGARVSDYSTAKQADIYEYLEEVDTEATDIYEAVDQLSNSGSLVEIYDTFQ